MSAASILVSRPAAEVFSFISTPENDPLWVRGCAANQRVKDEPIRVGSRVVEQLSYLGTRLLYEWEVTQLEPRRLITYSSRRGLVPMVITIAVRADGSATEVTLDIHLGLPRLVPFGAALGRLVGRRQARRNLADLRSHLEPFRPGVGVPPSRRASSRPASSPPLSP